MPEQRQDLSGFEAQFRDIIDNALDRRHFLNVVTPATPDQEFQVDHGLGFIPVGYVPIYKDKAGTVYNGTTAWTSQSIFLKANVATLTMKILVF